MALYVNLYDIVNGGGAQAFKCAADSKCRRVVPTLDGIKSHLFQKHGIRIQGSLFDALPETDKPQPDSSCVLHQGT